MKHIFFLLLKSHTTKFLDFNLKDRKYSFNLKLFHINTATHILENKGMHKCFQDQDLIAIDEIMTPPPISC